MPSAERLGTIKQIWRYPVKSMQGERLTSVRVGRGGLVGDRSWATRDEEQGEIRGGKRLAGLMQCSARYLSEPDEDKVGVAQITLPDGTRFASDAPDASDRLSEALAHLVTLWPLQPADQLDHYRRREPLAEAALRSIFALEPDEPLPDLAGIPEAIREFATPPGTYFDAFPLMMITQASLDELKRLAPDATIDVRRFRPNFLIDTGDLGPGFVERDWPGARLRCGELVVNITVPCVRCVMTTRGFADLPKEPKIMRTLVREAEQRLGVCAEVETPGVVRVGDTVERMG